MHTQEQKHLNKELSCSTAFDSYNSGMDRRLILLVAALMVYVAPVVQGTAHLSFANNTEVNITRTGCGQTKLCVETPDDCDPSTNPFCLFASVMAGNSTPPNGTMLSMELSGYSMGYVALGLTMTASEGYTMLFICAQDNGTFFFRTMHRNNTNNELTASETRTTEIRGLVKGKQIQCEFNVPNVNATNTRRSSADTTFTILLGTGSTNGTMIGSLNVTLNSGPLNVADPSSNVVNATATPTPTNVTMAGNSTTTGSSGAVQPHAVLLLLSVLTLSVMLRA